MGYPSRPPSKHGHRASATLATSMLLPDYKGKERTWPSWSSPSMHCRSWQWLSIRSTASGSDWTSGRLATGVMLGATIHVVAQVIGAGYAVSDAAPRFGHRLAVCATGGDERCGPDF